EARPGGQAVVASRPGASRLRCVAASLARPASHHRTIQVPRVLELQLRYVYSRGSHEEGPHLIPAERSVCTHLVVEADDGVAIVRSEQDQVSRVVLPNEGLQRADGHRIGAVDLQRVQSLE